MTKEIKDKYSDYDLVRLTQRDPRYFGRLMQRYEERLLRYIHRIVRVTREDAEDILQESFLKAYQNLNDFDTALAFSSWIYRIVHNSAMSAWRRSKVRPHGNSVDVDDDFLMQIVASDDATREVDRVIDKQKIQNIFLDMDEKYRTILILYFLEEKSYREISDILKKPMGTIATLVSRAKKQFRARCARAGIVFDY